MRSSVESWFFLALLFVDGVVVGILSVAFLSPYIGTVPVPVGVLIAAVGNAGLAVLASRFADGPRTWLPVLGWMAVVVVAMTGRPGGNVMLVNDWRTPLLLVAGLAAPAMVAGMVGTRRRVEAARRRDIERAARGR
ncbi:hypothetical protein [Gordonia sp. (in: high G+C Gram-positive bacteria)]|uniref:hypothetical protein n=1 Tax=Gordonia sp. (in: high G+C Gram-positive bacteria) TaxID=84139 RepID=UPI0039E2B967